MTISVYLLGYMARQRGFQKEENPLPAGTVWHEEWLRGYYHGGDENVPTKEVKVIPIKLLHS